MNVRPWLADAIPILRAHRILSMACAVVGITLTWWQPSAYANAHVPVVPAAWYRITSPYHYDEQHPFQRGWNRGVTVTVRGRDVHALSDGRVSFAGYIAHTGVVSIRRSGPVFGGVIVTYVGVLPHVHIGQRVVRGMAIAAPGSTRMHIGMRDASVRWRYIPLMGERTHPALQGEHIGTSRLQAIGRPAGDAPVGFAAVLGSSLEQIISGEVVRTHVAHMLSQHDQQLLRRHGQWSWHHPHHRLVGAPRRMYEPGRRARPTETILRGGIDATHRSASRTSLEQRMAPTIGLPVIHRFTPRAGSSPITRSHAAIDLIAPLDGIVGHDRQSAARTGIDPVSNARIDVPRAERMSASHLVGRKVDQVNARQIRERAIPRSGNVRELVRHRWLSELLVGGILAGILRARRARSRRRSHAEQSPIVIEQFIPAIHTRQSWQLPMSDASIRASMRRTSSDWVQHAQPVPVDQSSRHTV